MQDKVEVPIREQDSDIRTRFEDIELPKIRSGLQSIRNTKVGKALRTTLLMHAMASFYKEAKRKDEKEQVNKHFKKAVD